MPGFVTVGKKQSQAVGSKRSWMTRGVGVAGPPESGSVAREASWTLQYVTY